MHAIRRLILGLAAAGLFLQSPPAWAQAATCCGDCNGDGRVTVDEIIKLVNNVLSGQSAACSDGCQACGLFCIILVVNNAMDGCQQPPAAAAPATPVVPLSLLVQASNAPA